jgi:hypothetical protein
MGSLWTMSRYSTAWMSSISGESIPPAAPSDIVWSFSRHGQFEYCPRKYFFTYYNSSINGPFGEAVSYLKSLQSVPLALGVAVHSAIEKFLVDVKNGNNPTLEDLHARGRDELTQIVQKMPFQEHFFTAGSYSLREWRDATLTAALPKSEEALNHFYRSPILQSVILSHKGYLKQFNPERFVSFEVGEGIKVRAVIDLMVIWSGNPDNKLLLFDWKTGRASGSHDLQLGVYALWGQRVMKFPASSIVLTPFYLTQNNYTKTVATDVMMREVEKNIVASHANLLTLHRAPLSAFPYAPEKERWKCTYCQFRNLCAGVRYRKNAELSDVEAVKEAWEDAGSAAAAAKAAKKG